jgi:hypothetical protein
MLLVHRRVDLTDVPAPGMGQRTEDQSARAVVAHGMRDGVPLAQRVQHEAGDPGAVFRAGITGPLAPVPRGGFHRLVAVQDV